MAGGAPENPARKFAFRTAAACALLVSGVLWLPVGCFDDSLRGSAFSSTSWKSVSRSAESSEDNPRRAMVHDLVTRVGLKGKTEREVRDLLGPGTSWCLGPTREAMGSHQDFLSIDFGDDGRVSRVKHPGAW